MEYRVKHENGNILHVMSNVKLIKKNGELLYQRFLLDNTANKIKEDKLLEEAKKRQAELVKALSTDFNLVLL